ncbi:MAG: cell division protein FtsA [Deltaproteobacteria bacterium]|nr:cell division protein FtsA [Deltaproteobacteria bacterium]
MARGNELVVGLDIGTTKICSIVGEIQPEGGVDIVGIGTSPSRGLRKGVVINIETTVNSIKSAIEEAEMMAGCEIKTVYVGVAGGHIKGINSHGIVAVKDKEIRQSDVRRVIDAARAVVIPMDREVIHILPQEFIIDNQDGIKEPLGMSGVRLEAKVHLVTGACSSAQNLIKCANRTGLDVADLVLQPLASSLAVLTEDEKDLGVALIDIGGGTTDIAVFANGSIVHTAVLSLGGNQITNDIALGLRTPAPEAERLKIRSGCAMASLVDREEAIEVPSVGGRKSRNLSRQILCEIIEPRVEEIFSLVKREVHRSGFEDLLASGAVITGGSTIMEGMPELAEDVLGMPVRRGVPENVHGLVDVVRSPIFATGVGLVHYGRRHLDHRFFPIRPDKNLYARIKQRMKGWIHDFF